MTEEEPHRWTHNICDRCWLERCEKREEVGRQPTRVMNSDLETCCYCQGPTSVGIYVRDDPKEIKCGEPTYTTTET